MKEGPKRGRKSRYGVSPREFVQAWEESASAEEAAARLKMPKDIVLARVSAYRTKGIRLKRMPRNLKGGLDIEELNALIDTIEQARAGGQPTPRPAPEEPDVVVSEDEPRQTVRKVLRGKA